MHMYIYIDVFIVINFMLNGIILYLTAYLNNIKCNIVRLVIANLFSISYLVLGLVLKNEFFYHPIVKFIISACLIFIFFGKQSIRNFTVLLGSFYLISFLLGGAIFGYLFMTDTTIPLGDQTNRNFYLSAKHIVTGFFIGIIIILFIFRTMASEFKNRSNYYRVKITYQNQSVSIMTLLDTGNKLYTIQDHYPVLLIEKQRLLSLFPDSVANYLKENKAEDWVSRLNASIDETWRKRLFFIPYKSLGGNHILLAFRPDSVIIEDRVKQRTTQVAIGIYEGTFSDFGQYEGLLHPDIVTNNLKRG